MRLSGFPTCGVRAAPRSGILKGAIFIGKAIRLKALVAARKRGVAVHVLLNEHTTESLATERWLVRHGITVRWATGPYLHAKVLLVDGHEGMIGSANFSYHGMTINHEFDVSVPAAVIPQAMQWFSGLWSQGRPT